MKMISFLTLILLIAACNGSDNSIYVDESLMSYKPYAQLTDSLRKKENATQYYKRGALSYSLQNYRSAYKDYQKAFSLQPSQKLAEAIVSSLYQLKSYDSVINFVEKEKHFFPGNRLHEILGATFQQAGNYKQALYHLEEQLKTDTGNYYLLFQKGVLLENLNDTPNAIRYYEQALHKLPDMPDVKFALASLYASTGNSKTMALCEMMLKDTSNFHAEPLYLQGIYFISMKQFGKAIDAFNRSIARDWKYIDSYIEKGKLYFNQKKYNEALQTFELALQVQNTNADVYFWIGRCKEMLNQKEEAIDYYKKTLGLDDTYEEATAALKRLGQQ
jgi:tetratricopeptide (TPR) repeat protein